MSKVDIHPISAKLLRQGHPWVIKDRFTDKFPKDAFILVGSFQNQEMAQLLHDPHHPKIKARLWRILDKTSPKLSRKSQTELKQEFLQELALRLEKAISHRAHASYIKERENFYLTFGEADGLPGLFILKLGQTILAQLYAEFWRSLEVPLIQKLEKIVSTHWPKTQFNLLFQYRGKKGEGFFCPLKTPSATFICPKLPFMTTIKEFGSKIELRFDNTKGADYGLYSDMASIRKALLPFIGHSQTFLNLYSYTGAYSLWALRNKMKNVVSVDVSRANLEWLEHNLTLNPHLPIQNHETICQSVEKALEEFKKKNRHFDFIICDPPSLFSEKSKTVSALKYYENLLPDLLDVLAPKGRALLLLNTHKVTFKSYKATLQNILVKLGPKKRVKVLREFSLGQDCPKLRNFPEGDYLKGLLIEREG